MTLVELRAPKPMMKSMKTKATARCTFLRRSSSSSRPKISTHTLVVRAVRAESALEKLAATTPIVKNTVTIDPKAPEAANIGNRSSGFSGRAMPCDLASIISSTPRERKSRLAGTKAKP